MEVSSLSFKHRPHYLCNGIYVLSVRIKKKPLPALNEILRALMMRTTEIDELAMLTQQ
jgi:hypothetical protein